MQSQSVNVQGPTVGPSGLGGQQRDEDADGETPRRDPHHGGLESVQPARLQSPAAGGAGRTRTGVGRLLCRQGPRENPAHAVGHSQELPDDGEARELAQEGQAVHRHGRVHALRQGGHDVDEQRSALPVQRHRQVHVLAPEGPLLPAAGAGAQGADGPARLVHLPAADDGSRGRPVLQGPGGFHAAPSADGGPLHARAGAALYRKELPRQAEPVTRVVERRGSMSLPAAHLGGHPPRGRR